MMFGAEYLAFIGEAGKTAARDLAIHLAMFLFPAIALFGFGIAKEKETGKTWVKFLAGIPLLLAVLNGWKFFAYMTMPWMSFERAAAPVGGNSAIAYHASFLLPLVCLLGMVVLFVIQKARPRRDVDF